MTDRQTGVEVLELIGQATAPPLSAAGSARVYDDTAQGLKVSVNGLPYGSLGAVETVEYLPSPELPTNTTPAAVASATLEGGSFILPRPVQLNRVIVQVTAFTAPASGVLAIYQNPAGRVVDSLARVVTCPFTPVGPATLEITPNEGTVILSSGFFYALWGQASGAGTFSLRVYSHFTNDLLTTGVPTGIHPGSATSALSPATPPATLDPMIGGDLVGASALDVVPVMRFRKV